MRRLWKLGLDLFVQYRSFILYSLIGVSGATIDFVVFWLLVTYTTLDKFLVNAMSVTLGITNNFLLNAFVNFKTKDNLLKRFVLFYSVGILGLGLSEGILWIFADLLGFNVSLVKFLSIIVIVLVQYNLNRLLAFGGRDARKG